MKNIVIGIDFSEGSINALKHGISLGNRFKAKLHLVWCCTPGSVIGLSSDSIETLTKKAKLEMKELIREYDKELTESRMTPVFLEGKPHLKLTEYAAGLKDAMIVIGTHGMSGFEEFFIGSNAYKTILVSQVPVLSVRHDVSVNKELTDILVHIDSSVDSLQKLPIAIELAKAYAAKIWLVGVLVNECAEAKKAIEVLMEKSSRKCERKGVRYSTDYFKVKHSAPCEVIAYAKKKKINLMVVLKDQELEMSSFFSGSFTKQIIKRSTVPVCTIPNPNLSLVTK